MRISALAVTLVAVGTAGCGGGQGEPTKVATGEPGFCDVLSTYLTAVAEQRIDEPMPQLDGFESSCAAEGDTSRAIVCRFDTPEEHGGARYNEVVAEVLSCLPGWAKEQGDSDPSGAPETYRWTTVSEPDSGGRVQTRLHWYQNRLVVDLAVSRE